VTGNKVGDGVMTGKAGEDFVDSGFKDLLAGWVSGEPPVENTVKEPKPAKDSGEGFGLVFHCLIGFWV
jgi:hypothetical protein